MSLSPGILALPVAIRPSTYPIAINDVASQDIVAPYSLSFPSQVLTDQAPLQEFFTSVARDPRFRARTLRR